MNYTIIVERLKSLRLQGMADALENILTARQSTHLSTEQLLELLVQHEYDVRYNRRIDRLTRQARFRYQVSLDQVQPQAKRNLDAQQLAA